MALFREGKVSIENCDSPPRNSTQIQTGQSGLLTSPGSDASAGAETTFSIPPPSSSSESNLGTKAESPNSHNITQSSTVSKLSLSGLADLCRVVVVIALLVYLVRCGLQWGAVHGKMARLEHKIDQLDRMISNLLAASADKRHHL